METLPLQSTIFIPENKVSCWVMNRSSSSSSSSSKSVERDTLKEFQGVWIVDSYTLDKRKDSNEVWIFYDDDKLGIDDRGK